MRHDNRHALHGVVRVLVLASLTLTACPDDKEAPGSAPSRFAGVNSDQNARAIRAFCEKSFAAKGAGSLRLPELPEKALPVARPAVATARGWRWINLWATWCTPCVEEMPLLQRWLDSLTRDGVAVKIELWSADDDQEALAQALRERKLPGEQHWLGGNEALSKVLEAVQAGQGAALPVHLFVDDQNQLRCLRVGSVHEADYGAIKTLLTSGG
ncbi:MAG: TlpA disulfide reductase family protein [Pseudomonadota bacterium]